jgi:hypothetical protein
MDLSLIRVQDSPFVLVCNAENLGSTLVFLGLHDHISTMVVGYISEVFYLYVSEQYDPFIRDRRKVFMREYVAIDFALVDGLRRVAEDKVLCPIWGNARFSILASYNQGRGGLI